jgi:DNA-binding protein HU-beta
MNRVELIELIAQEHSLSKAEAGRVLGTVLDAVVNTVKKGGTVTLPGFGSFKQTSRAARTGRNPATGDKLKIAASKLPKFTAGSKFKAAVDPKGAARKAAKAAAAAPAPKAAVAKKAAAKPAAKAAVKAAAKPAAKAKK